MNKNAEIQQQVLTKITPLKKDRIQLDNVINKVLEIVKNQIEINKIQAKIELVGSTAKDTFLKNNLDIDIFLKFPSEIKKEIMAKQTLSIGRKILTDTEECYAEHPYIRGAYNDYKVELVPCYEIIDASQKISAVDRTPLHTKYIMENITENQKQQVRIFKQFLHGIRCYGAEAEIEGFSGYLCEILILYYNTFDNLIKDAISWKKGKNLTLLKQKIPTFKESLIFIDPVDSERNVASAISPETYNRFIYASQQYIKNPSIKFFFPKQIKHWNLEKIKKTLESQQKKYLAIKIQKPNLIPENLYPQIRKACIAIKKGCTKYGFTIYDIPYHIDDTNKDIYIIIKTDNDPISDVYTHMGPPIKLKDHTKEFLGKWNDNRQTHTPPYIENDRYYVKLKRKYIQIEDYLKSNLSEFSMGKHLDLIISQDFKIIQLNDLLIKPLQIFWTTYLDGKQSWER
jgi:tRNA nucleotidyltransferase (CCA-adding enzyme)